MNDQERKNMLADLKARQVKQEHMPCPRCGKDTMGEDPMRNALSRQADVMVCDSCGQNEAVLAMMNNPLPLSEWAFFNPPDPEADAVRGMSAKDVRALVLDKHLETLITLFERWQDEHEYEDFSEYRIAAKKRCPGLTSLQSSPFRAEFQAKDGRVCIRFRSRNGKTEYSDSILP